jgi:hypothetical protein
MAVNRERLFPLISDDAVEEPKTYEETAAGESVLRDERAYLASNPDDDDSFDHDDTQFGTVHITQTRPARPPDAEFAVVRVVIKFGKESLTASGTLQQPIPDGEVGRLAIVGITDPDKKDLVGKTLLVRERNPKRWSIEGGP